MPRVFKELDIKTYGQYVSELENENLDIKRRQMIREETFIYEVFIIGRFIDSKEGVKKSILDDALGSSKLAILNENVPLSLLEEMLKSDNSELRVGAQAICQRLAESIGHNGSEVPETSHAAKVSQQRTEKKSGCMIL